MCRSIASPPARTDYIGAARRDPDGRALRFALARKVKFNSMVAGERLFVDLLPEAWTGEPPGLPRRWSRIWRGARARPSGRARSAARARAAAQDPAGQRAGREAADVHALHLRTAGVDRRHHRPRQGQADAEFRRAAAVRSCRRQARLCREASARSMPSLDLDSSEVRFAFSAPVDVRSFREDFNFVVDVSPLEVKPRCAASEPAAVAPGPLAGVEPPQTVPAKPPQTVTAQPPRRTRSRLRRPRGSRRPRAIGPAMPGVGDEQQPAARNEKQAAAAPPQTRRRRGAETSPRRRASAAPAAAASAASGAASRRAATPRPWLQSCAGRATASAWCSRSPRRRRPRCSSAPTRCGWCSTPAPSSTSPCWRTSRAAPSAAPSTAARATAQVVRLKLERPRLVSVAPEGNGWAVTLGDTVQDPTKPLMHRPQHRRPVAHQHHHPVRRAGARCIA